MTKKTTARDLISISKVSTLLTGNPFKLRYDRDMGADKERVNKLLDSVDSWIADANKPEVKIDLSEKKIDLSEKKVVAEKEVKSKKIKSGDYSRIIHEPFDPKTNCLNCKYEFFTDSYRIVEKCDKHKPKI